MYVCLPKNILAHHGMFSSCGPAGLNLIKMNLMHLCTVTVTFEILIAQLL